MNAIVFYVIIILINDVYRVSAVSGMLLPYTHTYRCHANVYAGWLVYAGGVIVVETNLFQRGGRSGSGKKQSVKVGG